MSALDLKPLNLTEKHSERAHAVLSASGSERWIECPASALLEKDLPEETSVYAEEGTLAHEFAEAILRLDLKLLKMQDYKAKIEELKKHPLYYHDLMDDVMPYVNYVKNQFKAAKVLNPNSYALLEQKFSLEKYVKDGFGTSDASIISLPVIEVMDLKFGKGKMVSAVENSQLKHYALGIIETLTPIQLQQVETIRLTIVQPRLENISTWELPVNDLIIWAEEVLKPKALEAMSENAEQKAGDWCQFCKVRPKCRKLYERGMEIAKQDFDVILDPRLLTDSEILEAYKSADFITKWLADVKAMVLKEAVAGKQWEGFKLVEGKSNRTWKDESLVIQELESDFFEPEEFMNSKLKGLGDLEKLLGKAKFNSLLGKFIVKPVGAPTLVDADDKRPEIGEARAKRDFEILD